MSDKATSGPESTAAAENAPAETPRDQTAPAAEFAFGTGRGTGLARGKRKPAKGAPPATSSAPVGDYQPTAVQIVTTESEYKNPFAPAEPEAVPAAEVPAPAANPVASAPEVTATAPTRPTPTPAPAKPEPTPLPTPVEAAPEEKAELDILPPKQTRNSTQRWEAETFSENSGEERPTFKPRSQRASAEPDASPRSRSGERRPRSERPSRENSERRPRAPKHVEVDVPKPKLESTKSSGGGFFAWLKNLFTGDDPKPAPRKKSDGNRSRSRGRGRGQGRGEGRGEGRGGKSSGSRGPRSERGEQGSEGGGNRRRRSRGGRSRGRGRGKGGSGNPPASDS